MSLRSALTVGPEVLARLIAHRGKLGRGLSRWRSSFGPCVWQIGVAADQFHLQALFQHLHEAGARVPYDLGAIQDALQRLTVILVPSEPGFRQIGLWRGRGEHAQGLLVMQRPASEMERADMARAVASMIFRRVPALPPQVLLAGWAA